MAKVLISSSRTGRSSSWVLDFMQRRVLVRVILIALSFTTVSVALLTIPQAALDYWYLYFSPILLATFSFGLRGAAFASAAAAVHVLALQEWSQIFSSQIGLPDGLGLLAASPQQSSELWDQLSSLPADEAVRRLWAIAAATPDSALQSAQAGIGLILIVGAALAMGWLVDQNHRKEEILMRLATTDPLTGVWNRRAFQDRLALEVDRANRTGRSFALLMIDIDHFKTVNDSFGHLAGDAALRQVAERIVESVRAIDLVARYGGEEFAVILVDVDPASVEEIANRVRQAIESMPIQVRSNAHAALSLSIGYALFPADAGDADALIGRADDALYFAKSSGRNCTIAASNVPRPDASAGAPQLAPAGES